MIKATRVGIKAIFSDNDWKSGQPQRYGWQEEGKEGKTLPKEIIQFIERRKAPEPSKEVKDEPIKVTLTWPKELTPEKPTDPLKDEPIVQVNKKTKKNDNPKQKDGRTAKRKPRRVAKA